MSVDPTAPGIADDTGHGRGGSSRRAEAARGLDYFLAVLRDHWLAALVVATGVFLLMIRSTLLEEPVFTSRASVNYEEQREMATGRMASWYDSSYFTLKSELVLMRSYPVALEAASTADLAAWVEERDGHRPLEAALRRFGLHPPLTAVEATAAPLPEGGPGERRYVLRWRGKRGPLEARAREDGPVLATASAETEGVWRLNLDGHDVRLTVAEGPVEGKTFDLVLRSQAAVAGLLRLGAYSLQAEEGVPILTVGYSTADPRLAQRGAQALAEGYKRWKDGHVRSTSDARVAWLKGRIGEARTELKTAEDRLDLHVATKGAVMLSEQASGIIEDQGRLVTTRIEVQQALDLERQASAELESAMPINRLLVLLGPERVDSKTTALAGRVADLEIQKGTLLRLDSTPENLAVKRIDAEMAEAEARLREQSDLARLQALEVHRRKIQQLQRQLASIESEHDLLEQRLQALPAKERDVARLQRDVDFQARTYAELVRLQQEAELGRETLRSSVTLVEAAPLPTVRERPALGRALALALVLAGVAGAAMAFLLAWRDRTIHTPQALERETSLPLYGAIPTFGSVSLKERRRIKGLRVPAAEAPQSVIAEAYRTLRANLKFAATEGSVRTLAITSSTEQEGKTITTLNLATVMAQSGSRVMVVDADLRRPSVHTNLDLPFQPGLVQVLEGKAGAWREMKRRYEPGGFDVLVAGGHPAHPGRLLESAVFQALLEDLVNAYDHVLVDVPPVLAAADPSAFFSRLDGVLLLARDGRVTPEVVESARDRIRRVGGRLLGCVFNGFDARRVARKAYGYGYGYGFGGYPYYARGYYGRTEADGGSGSAEAGAPSAAEKPGRRPRR